MKSVEGYNVLLKVNGKTFAGTTSDSLNISADIKESLFKSDNGQKKYEVISHNTTIEVNGAIQILEDSEQTPEEVEINPMDLALLTGSAAQIPMTYLAANGGTYAGTAVIASYKEDSSASDIVTYSMSLNVTNFAKSTQ